MPLRKKGSALLRAEIERDTGLRVVEIETQNKLTEYLDAGLSDLYQRVFAEPPYDEKFSREEIKEIFQEFFGNKGNIFVAIDRQNKRPVAFVVSVPLRTEFALAALVKDKINVNQTAYFAEDGVEADYRRRGLSGKMKNLLLEANSLQGFKTLLLRTNQNNYKQISAVNKAGGVVIPGLFNDIVNKRGDGTMTTDKRAFYTFDTQTYTREADNAEVLERVVIARPGGNDTAIVFDSIPRERQAAVSLRIQQVYPGIEQVMFAEEGKQQRIRGQMAGGEFCGNATRSLGYVLRNGNMGTETLEVSGSTEPVQVAVSEEGARTSIPLKPGFDCIKAEGRGEYIVDMEGISFFVTEPSREVGRKILSIEDEDERKILVKSLLEEKGLAGREASSVLIAEKTGDNSYKLDPFVFVRDTGTLYYETGCGSGSAALGAIIALENGTSLKNLQVRQPSGMCLHCLY